LQFFSTGGLLLGLSYLLLCGATVFVAAKLLKSLDSEIRYTTLTLFSAWVALQAQSLISIDSIGISIWIWVLGGAIIGLGRNQLVFKKDVLEQQSIKSKTLLKSEIYQKVYLVLLLIPTAMISYLLFQSEVDTYKSQFFTVPSATQNQSAVQDFSDQVLRNSLSDPQYKLFVAINLFEMGLKLEAYKQVNEQLNADPHNLDILNTLVFMTADLEKFEDTILIREKIAKLDPWNAENHLALLKFYQENGDLVRANFNYDKIMSFAQNTEIAVQAKKILEQ
jgi:tetratricopeptide (TPR) repeat protein